ncbi:hypothetical protein Hanom_Chr00s024500g01763661 [Helianthus anomalus]
MHHVVALIAERHKGRCTNWSLSRLLCALGPRLDTKLQSSRGSHYKQPLYSYEVEVRLSTSTLLRPYLSFAIGGIY